MADKVKVKIKPLKGIGGVGNAGDVVLMTPAEAEMYFRDGYVEYVSDERLAVSEEQVATPPPAPPQIQSANLERGAEDDHAIMKTQSKRGRKK